MYRYVVAGVGMKVRKTHEGMKVVYMMVIAGVVDMKVRYMMVIAGVVDMKAAPSPPLLH